MNPPKETNIFHAGCNPEPLLPPSQPKQQQGPYTIGFQNNAFEQIGQMFKKWLEGYMRDLKISEADFRLGYNKKDQIVFVQIKNSKSFETVLNFIESNIEALDKELGECIFARDQSESSENHHLFKNVYQGKAKNESDSD